MSTLVCYGASQRLIPHSQNTDEVPDILEDGDDHTSATEFVTKFSKINIVLNQHFADLISKVRTGHQDIDLSTNASMGNSRDVQTAFEFPCDKEGCSYTTIRPREATDHKGKCGSKVKIVP